MKNICLYFLLFCYIFSFYIFAIPMSMIIACPIFILVCANKKYMKSFLKIWGMKFIRTSFIFLIFINFLTLFFTIVFEQFDISLSKIMITQIIHFICAIFFFTYIDVNNFSFTDVCSVFVNIFVIQTFIQILGFLFPEKIGKFLRLFNHYDPSSVIGLGDRVRGFALSAATTYHLSLIYGACFIVFVKQLIEKKYVSFFQILKGFIITVGIFFAGRTGFVGVGIGCIYFLFTLKNNLKKKFYSIFKVFISVFFVITIFLSFTPQKTKDLVLTYLIPYAFEFVYSKFDSGTIETASTNQLKKMWNTNLDEKEILLGSGKYTNLDDSYYMHVDPGILRHTLYGGILFYICLLLYQIFFLSPLIKKKYFYIFVLLIIYFVLMDFKGVTIAVNKFVFSFSLLFGYISSKKQEKKL